MMKHYAVTFLFLAFTLFSFSQPDDMGIGFRANLGIPQGPFATEINRNGFGAGIEFTMPLWNDSPLYAGAAFDLVQYGKRVTRFNEEIVVRVGSTVIDRIPVVLDVTTSNNVMHFMGLFRFQAPTPYVKPYAELTGGLQYIYTRTRITDETTNRIFTSGQDNNEISASTQMSDFTYAFGGGVGILIPLRKLSLDFRAHYLIGGRANYYTRDQINQWTVEFSGSAGEFNPSNPENIELEQQLALPKNTQTDQLLFRVGVRIPIEN